MASVSNSPVPHESKIVVKFAGKEKILSEVKQAIGLIYDMVTNPSTYFKI